MKEKDEAAVLTW